MHILRQLTSKHKDVRTTEIRGHAADLPKVASQFVFYSEALDSTIRDIGGVRTLVTSPIIEVARIEDQIYQFATANSTYELIIEEEE